MPCRICLEEKGPFINPCACKGSSTVHEKCLVRWIEESERNYCEICKQNYTMKEAYSCNCKKTCEQMTKCSVPSVLNMMYRKVFSIIFCMSSMLLIVTQESYTYVSVCISTLLICFYTFMISVKHFGNIMGIYNAALFWKFAFTLPFSISTALIYTSLFDTCHLSCITMENECNASCPVYKLYHQKSLYLLSVWLFDFSILFTIFMLRNIMVCYFYMRSLKFQEFDPEKESLLSSSSDASGASSSGASSSGVESSV